MKHKKTPTKPIYPWPVQDQLNPPKPVQARRVWHRRGCEGCKPLLALSTEIRARYCLKFHLSGGFFKPPFCLWDFLSLPAPEAAWPEQDLAEA